MLYNIYIQQSVGATLKKALRRSEMEARKEEDGTMSEVEVGMWIRSIVFKSIGKVTGFTKNGRIRVEKVNGGIGIWKPRNVVILPTND